MLIKKCLRVIKNNGFSALFAKSAARLRYRSRAREYMKERERSKRQRIPVFERDVLLSIAVPLYNTPQKYLRQMLDSVVDQTYSNWELCLADASDEDGIYEIVREYQDKRIKYKRLDKNYGIAENTNIAVSMAEGEYVGLLDHDDILDRDLLTEYRRRIDKGADFIYCDEASFRSDPYKPEIIHFKPAFSPFNLRGNNYICHFSMFRRSLFDEVGGLREGFEGSQDHDLILRLTERARKVVHVPQVLYYWRIHRDSVAMDISAKPRCISSGVLAVSESLLRLKIEGKVEPIGGGAAVYRCKYKVRGGAGCRRITRCRNHALEDCTCEYIAVLPKGVKLSRSDMLRLISLASLEGVGAAGGLGVYHGRVVSGAVRFDGEDCIEMAMDGERLSSGGYMHRLCYVQNVNALNTAAVFSRAVFEMLGGFDETLKEEERLIDLCLRMRAKGFNVLLDPMVRVKVQPAIWEMDKEFEDKHKERLGREDEYFTNDFADYTM